jgi:hypothetical protein
VVRPLVVGLGSLLIGLTGADKVEARDGRRRRGGVGVGEGTEVQQVQRRRGRRCHPIHWSHHMSPCFGRAVAWCQLGWGGGASLTLGLDGGCGAPARRVQRGGRAPRRPARVQRGGGGGGGRGRSAIVGLGRCGMAGQWHGNETEGSAAVGGV